MSSDLWQILIKIRNGPSSADLTCDECFTLLDYLVSQISQEALLDELYEVALKHWQHCPHCREHHLRRLKELEASYWSHHQTSSSPNTDPLLICKWPQGLTNDRTDC